MGADGPAGETGTFAAAAGAFWATLWAGLARGALDALDQPAARPAADEAAELLWRAAETQGVAWSTALAEAAHAMAEDEIAAATLARFLDPSQWLFGGDGAPEPALRPLLAMPGGDFGRDGLIRGPEAAALRAALARHSRIVARAYLEMAEAAARRAADRPDLSLETAQAAWVDAAAELDRLHASDAFLASQADVVAAASALRAAEARAVEAFCRERGLPTRADVDELAETVAALRRELRALRREAGRE